MGDNKVFVIKMDISLDLIKGSILNDYSFNLDVIECKEEASSLVSKINSVIGDYLCQDF